LSRFACKFQIFARQAQSIDLSCHANFQNFRCEQNKSHFKGPRPRIWDVLNPQEAREKLSIFVFRFFVSFVSSALILHLTASFEKFLLAIDSRKTVFFDDFFTKLHIIDSDSYSSFQHTHLKHEKQPKSPKISQ
jgi:hypothetical protein